MLKNNIFSSYNNKLHLIAILLIISCALCQQKAATSVAAHLLTQTLFPYSNIQPQTSLLPLHNFLQTSNNTSLNKSHKTPYSLPILHSLTPTAKHISIATLFIILPILFLKKLH